MSQTQQSKQKYIRALTKTKANQYLSVAIPSKLSKQLNLDHNSYVSICINQNKLIFERVKI
jgi:hypothetical protein